MRSILIQTVRWQRSRLLLCHRNEGIRNQSLSISLQFPGQKRKNASASALHSDDKSSLSTPYSVPARTAEQERAASLTYDQMKETTSKILNQSKSILTDVEIQLFRTAFHYWVKHRSNWRASPEECAQNAEDLLNWIWENASPTATEEIIRSEKSLSGGLQDLIEIYMDPFRGTFRANIFEEAGGKRRQNQDASTLVVSLEKASKIVQKMIDLHKDSLYPNLVPDSHSCVVVLDLWSKRCWFLREFGNNFDKAYLDTAMGGASTPSECLDAMRTLIQEMKNSEEYPSPNNNHYHIFLSALINSGVLSAGKEAQEVLRQMEEHGNDTMDIIPYNTVINLFASLAKKRNESYAEEAANLLNRLEKNQRNGVQPDVTTYATVLLAYSNAGRAEDAQKLLERMQSDDDVKVRPNSICFNTVIDAWAKSASPSAPKYAEAVLERMEVLYENGINPDARPNKISYSSVIVAWSRSLFDNAAERAASILFRTEEMSRQDGQSHVRPDLITYNSVLHAYARQAERQTKGRHGVHNEAPARKAEELLRHLQKVQNALEKDSTSNSSDIIRPNSKCFNTVMSTWIKSGSPNMGDHVQELFDEMQQEYKSGNESAKPDLFSYNILLTSLGRSNKLEEACAMLVQMQKSDDVKPDDVSYNTVMDALFKTGREEDASKAESILQSLEDRLLDGDEDAQICEISFNSILNGIAKTGRPDRAQRAEEILERMTKLAERTGNDSLRPSSVSYTTVLNIYAQSGVPEIANKVEELFHKWSQDPYFKPSRVTFNTVINALSKSRVADAPQRAEAILNRMFRMYEDGDKNVRPDHVSFSSVLNCWARSGQDGAAERAEAIVYQMEDLAHRGHTHVKPNEVSYSSVLNAWSKSGLPNAVERANALLDHMQKGGTKPNAYCYNAVINTIAKSTHLDKAQRAYEILNRMTDGYQKDGDRTIKPNTITYCSVLNACAYTDRTSVGHRDKAFDIARSVMLDLIGESDSELNENVYFQFLTACRQLLDRGPERDEIIEATFLECCKSGHVDEKLVGLLWQSLPPHICRELVPSQGNNCPPDWSRNISKREKHRTGGRQPRPGQGNRGRRPPSFRQ